MNFIIIIQIWKVMKWTHMCTLEQREPSIGIVNCGVRKEANMAYLPQVLVLRRVRVMQPWTMRIYESFLTRSNPGAHNSWTMQQQSSKVLFAIGRIEK